jgi:peroxiredoxin
MKTRLITPGEAAPDFELIDLTEERVKLSDFRSSRIIVLYFLRGFM